MGRDTEDTEPGTERERHGAREQDSGESEVARKRKNGKWREQRRGREEGQRVMEQKVRGRMMERVDWVKKEKE